MAKVNLDKLVIGTSPLTNTIYAGVTDKEVTVWSHKTDVTAQALFAVTEYLLNRTKTHDVVIQSKVKGKPSFRLILEEIKE